MITLFYVDKHFLLYKVEDFVTLRKTHRIIGEIIGNSCHIPALPIRLSPEEALLLVSKNVAEVKEIIGYTGNKDFMEEFETKMLDYQMADYQKNRKIQLENVIDLIVEQRRKMNDNRSKAEIFEEELNKTPPITRENMIWPIFTINSDFQQDNCKIVDAEVIQTCTTSLKYQVFEDLYNKGYCITGGAKFGGHFLVYFGDPICYHAIFIVKCVESDQKISTMEIVAFGRLGTSVKKRAVLASMVDGKICYVTINWIDA